MIRARHSLLSAIGPRRIGWLSSVVAALWLGACGPGDGPDLIFHGGPILTVDAEDRVAEAVAIREGVITAVGGAQDVLALASARTEVHDLQGRTLMPGFIAAHEHPTLSAVFGGVVDVSGFTHQSNAEVWDSLREEIARTPKGEWIFAMGIDPILVPDLELPTRKSLDAMAPDHPVVMVSQTMHSFWANSRAFAEAGITRDTVDPGKGSFYERDAEGELTGFISESAAASPLLEKLRSPRRLLGRYERVLDELLAAGFTSVASAGYNVPPILARYAASHRLRPRIRQFFYLAEDELEYLPDRPDRSDPFFRILGIKLWHDGSPYTGTMYLDEPYLDTPLARSLGIAPQSRGEPMIALDELVARIERYEADGWQVVVHSQGDRSNREVVLAFGRAPVPPLAAPRRIEHCVLLPVSILPELAPLHVSPSFHVNHIYYYGDALEDWIIGPTRAGRVLPLKTAFELGLMPTLHADSPMFPTDAFSLMKTAILRRTRSGRVLGADQAIRIEQAVRAMTIHGAHQLGVSDELGSIEVGKWGDLQLLSDDPYRVAPERLDAIEVLEVYVAGRRANLQRR
jgi:predicted amidohydrolase YtcJ